MGSSFYPGASNTIARLRAGQVLRAEREPTNKYDRNAVSVYFCNQKLGHFPRGFAAEIAPFMDAGNPVTVYKSQDPKFERVGVIVAQWDDGEVADGAAS
jgi:hypothetical protein